MPMKPATKNPSAQRKGRSSRACASPVKKSQASTKTKSGTTAVHRLKGRLNQRCRYWISCNGVRMLTAPMSTSVAAPSQPAKRRIRYCSGRCVFQMHQVAPSSAYPVTTATPVRMENGVSQSHQPPA